MSHDTPGALPVRTVLGDVPPATLGRVSAHEHVWVGPGLMTSLEPDFRLDDMHKVVTGVRDFAASGGSSLVDALPLVEGRAVTKLAEISRTSGVNIVAATGFHRMKYYSAGHWVHRLPASALAEIMVREITVGMDEGALIGPVPQATDIRAGVIKLAAEFHHLPSDSARLLDAVALAHQRTGAPVMVHLESGTAGHAVLDAFATCGVSPSVVMLSHADRNPDQILHLELAERGCLLGYDWLGRVRTRPDSVVYDLIGALSAAGHGDAITVGLDLVRHTYWPSYGGGPGLRYLFGEFVPRLRRYGIDEDVITAITIDNPARWLTFAPAGEATGVTKGPA